MSGKPHIAATGSSADADDIRSTRIVKICNMKRKHVLSNNVRDAEQKMILYTSTTAH